MFLRAQIHRRFMWWTVLLLLMVLLIQWQGRRWEQQRYERRQQQIERLLSEWREFFVSRKSEQALMTLQDLLQAGADSRTIRSLYQQTTAQLLVNRREKEQQQKQLLKKQYEEMQRAQQEIRWTVLQPLYQRALTAEPKVAIQLLRHAEQGWNELRSPSAQWMLERKRAWESYLDRRSAQALTVLRLQGCSTALPMFAQLAKQVSLPDDMRPEIELRLQRCREYEQ